MAVPLASLVDYHHYHPRSHHYNNSPMASPVAALLADYHHHHRVSNHYDYAEAVGSVAVAVLASYLDDDHHGSPYHHHDDY